MADYILRSINELGDNKILDIQTNIKAYLRPIGEQRETIGYDYRVIKKEISSKDIEFFKKNDLELIIEN